MKKYIYIVLAVMLAGCQFRKEEYVNFKDIEGTNGLKFRVIGQHNG